MTRSEIERDEALRRARGNAPAPRRLAAGIAALIIFMAPAALADSHAGGACEQLEQATSPGDDLVASACQQGYASDDGGCLALCSLALSNRHQARAALSMAERSCELAPSDPICYLARGVARATVMQVGAAAPAKGGPQPCDAAAMEETADDLALGGILTGRKEAPRGALLALEGLALQCADHGRILQAAFGALASRDAEIAAPLLATFQLDGGQPAGLTGGLLFQLAEAELKKGPPAAAPGVREAQYLFWLREAHRADARFMRHLPSQIVARAYVGSLLALQSRPSRAGHVLEGLLALAEMGGLDYSPPAEAAQAWQPWLAQTRPGATEQAALRRLVTLIDKPKSVPATQLLAFKLRLVDALATEDACSRALRIGDALARFEPTSHELALESFIDVAGGAAGLGEKAVDRCGPSTLRDYFREIRSQAAAGRNPFPENYTYGVQP